MVSILSRLAVLGVLAGLSACAGGPLGSVLPDHLIPFAAPGARAGDPVFDYRPARLDAAPATGSPASPRVDAVAGDVRELQEATSSLLLRYEALTTQSAAVADEYFSLTSSLGVAMGGGGPGPEAVNRRLARARDLLGQIEENRAGFDRLASEVSRTTAEANLVRADIWPIYEAAGTRAGDQRRLEVLEDEANRMISVLARLTYRIAADMARQAALIDGERATLAALGRGEAAPAGRGRGPALVTIRFDRGRPAYEDQLYQAVVAALQAHPSARFDVVAVSPRAGDAELAADGRAQEGAEAVLRTLVEIGLPADRLALSAESSAGVAGSEVRVYVR